MKEEEEDLSAHSSLGLHFLSQSWGGAGEGFRWRGLQLHMTWVPSFETATLPLPEGKEGWGYDEGRGPFCGGKLRGVWDRLGCLKM